MAVAVAVAVAGSAAVSLGRDLVIVISFLRVSGVGRHGARRDATRGPRGRVGCSQVHRGSDKHDTGLRRTGRLAEVAGCTGGRGPRKPPLGARANRQRVAVMAACHSHADSLSSRGDGAPDREHARREPFSGDAVLNRKAGARMLRPSRVSSGSGLRSPCRPCRHPCRRHGRGRRRRASGARPSAPRPREPRW